MDRLQSVFNIIRLDHSMQLFKVPQLTVPVIQSISAFFPFRTLPTGKCMGEVKITRGWSLFKEKGKKKATKRGVFFQPNHVGGHMGWDVADSKLTTWVFPYPKHRELLYNRVVLSRRIKLTIWTTRWICWYSITWCARRWLFFVSNHELFSYFWNSSWIWGYP